MLLNTLIVSVFCPAFGKLHMYSGIMLPIDFHTYAQTRAAQPVSASVSGAEMFLAITIRRTTLSFVWKHRATQNSDARTIARHSQVSEA
ncbi:hypothetical protein AL073_04850 [Loktanella sp. 1ANDIMAR09]|nr:hypothetical protein AL073_04850 [Loktanella sp. 1ANDIMAR09]